MGADEPTATPNVGYLRASWALAEPFAASSGTTKDERAGQRDIARMRDW